MPATQRFYRRIGLWTKDITNADSAAWDDPVAIFAEIDRSYMLRQLSGSGYVRVQFKESFDLV